LGIDEMGGWGIANAKVPLVLCYGFFPSLAVLSVNQFFFKYIFLALLGVP